jgi:3',5'-cyclic-AMP phosphodiesterase
VADDGLTARASAAELRLTLTRTDPALTTFRLRLVNLHPGVRLEGPPGVLESAQGEPLPDEGLGRAWTVRFPQGVDTLALATAPLPAGDFVFLAFGDIQTGIDRFGEMVDVLNREEAAEFALMLGDLTQRATPAQFERVQAQFRRLRMPLYATPGNHDIFEERTYQDRFGRASYSFTHRGARFTSVDSASARLDDDVWPLLEGWLDAGRDAVHVVFSHIPPLEKLGLRAAQWSAPREARRFIALAGRGRVDRLLFGHVHTYDAYSLGGVPTHISGGCGAIEERWDGIGRHYLRIHVSPAQGTTRVDVVPIDEGG